MAKNLSKRIRDYHITNKQIAKKLNVNTTALKMPMFDTSIKNLLEKL